MAGNTFGQLFTVTSCGESHGPGLMAIVDGCPSGLEISESDLQFHLDRRKPGQSRFTTQRREPDQVEIISGVFEGKTTGAPIGLLIRNVDQKSKDYTEIKDKFRPGHADFTYHNKYGLRDYRGGGRSSARETALRVAAGAIARKYLQEKFKTEITAYIAQIGSVEISEVDFNEINNNVFFSPDRNKVTDFETLITKLRKEGDSCGAKVNVIAKNIPVGLGEPVFDRLDADIAKAMMNINAAKAVGIGAGFACVAQTGSQHRDEITKEGFLSNEAGGVLGGISTGQDIEASVAFKPTSSIRIPGKTIDIHGKETEVVTTGRHDPCVGIRAVPIVEAMLALVLMDHYLRFRGQIDQ